MGKISVPSLRNKRSYTTEGRVTIQDLTFAKSLNFFDETDAFHISLTHIENMN